MDELITVVVLIIIMAVITIVFIIVTGDRFEEALDKTI